MAKTTNLDQRDNQLAGELEAFKNAIGPYASRLGVSPDQVAAQAADSDYFSYTLAVQDLLNTSSKQWNNWKTLLRDGGNVPVTGTPQPPIFPAAPPPPVPPGIEPRFRALVKQIRASAIYNPSIGAALGLEDPGQTGPNYATLAPEIVAVIGDMNVRVAWNGAASPLTSTSANSRSIAATERASLTSPSERFSATSTPSRFRPRRRNGPIGPSTAPAATASVNGADG